MDISTDNLTRISRSSWEDVRGANTGSGGGSVGANSFLTSPSVINLSLVRSSNNVSEDRSLGASSVSDILPDNTVDKIDGLMVVGEDWSIIEIDGLVQVKQFPKVHDRKISYFKGLEEILNPCDRIYEMDFIMIDNCEMSMLWPSRSNRTVVGTEIRYNLMVSAVHDIIRKTVVLTSSKSSVDMKMRTDKHIVIYEKDWMDLAPLVADRLNNLTSLEQELLPDCRKTFFLVKKVGQDRDVMTHNLYRYPLVNVQRAAMIAVHVAIDITVPESIVWWNESVGKTINLRPKKSFNVGLLRGCNNYKFEIPPNIYHVHHMQFYTRLFHQVHRDNNKYFIEPYISSSLAKMYGSFLSHEKKPKKYDEKTKNIFNGVLDKAIEGIIESVKQTHIVGRIECVWAFNQFYVRDNPEMLAANVHHVFCQAVMDSERFCDTLNLFNSTDIYTTLKISVYAPSVERWIRTLYATMKKVVIAAELIAGTKDDLFSAPIDAILTVQDFANSYVAEAFLSRLFKGYFGKYPNFLEGFVGQNDWSPTRLPEWPFSELFTIVNGTISTGIDIHRLFKDFNTILLGNYPNIFGVFMTHYQMMKSFTTSTPENIISETIRAMITELASLIMCHMQHAIGLTFVAGTSLIRSLWLFKTRRHAKKVRSTFDVYNILRKQDRGISVALIPLSPLLENIRSVMSHRFRGGFQLYLGSEFQQLIIMEGLPLKIPYNKFSVVIITPICFEVAQLQRVVKIHTTAFIEVYGVRLGRRRIDVSRFFSSVMEGLNTEPPETLCLVNVGTVYDLIHRLLDDDESVYTTDGFQRQLSSVKHGLRNPAAVPTMAQPPTRPTLDNLDVPPTNERFNGDNSTGTMDGYTTDDSTESIYRIPLAQALIRRRNANNTPLPVYVNDAENISNASTDSISLIPLNDALQRLKENRERVMCPLSIVPSSHRGSTASTSSVVGTLSNASSNTKAEVLRLQRGRDVINIRRARETQAVIQYPNSPDDEQLYDSNRKDSTSSTEGLADITLMTDLSYNNSSLGDNNSTKTKTSHNQKNTFNSGDQHGPIRLNLLGRERGGDKVFIPQPTSDVPSCGASGVADFTKVLEQGIESIQEDLARFQLGESRTDQSQGSNWRPPLTTRVTTNKPTLTMSASSVEDENDEKTSSGSTDGNYIRLNLRQNIPTIPEPVDFLGMEKQEDVEQQQMEGIPYNSPTTELRNGSKGNKSVSVSSAASGRHVRIWLRQNVANVPDPTDLNSQNSDAYFNRETTNISTSGESRRVESHQNCPESSTRSFINCSGLSAVNISLRRARTAGLTRADQALAKMNDPWAVRGRVRTLGNLKRLHHIGDLGGTTAPPHGGLSQRQNTYPGRNPTMTYRKYKPTETRKLFEFIKKNKLYNFMKGNLIYKKMEELEVLENRTWQGMQRHVISALRDLRSLQTVITEEEIISIREATEKIARALHRNVISKEELNKCTL